MLQLAAIGLAMAPVYSDYPVFVNKNVVVEAYTDLGPIIEMIVKCPDGTGIISYSKVEKLYCSSKLDCFKGIHAAVSRTCG